MDLPSAGMIRFRFNGSAFASQPSGKVKHGLTYPWAPRGSANIGEFLSAARALILGVYRRRGMAYGSDKQGARP